MGGDCLNVGCVPSNALSAAKFSDLGIDVFIGDGEFSGRSTFEINGQTIRFAKAAMTHGIRLGQFASAIHPYPTQAEAVRKLGDAYSRTRLTPTVKALMHTFLKWRR